jgi:Fur family peroxide stress response transcriptional regulator
VVTGRRSTRQRQLILDIVSESNSHPAADQVYAVAKRSLPAISLGTVYRNLRLLVEEGKLREVQFAGDVTRYDGMLDCHEHFYCRRCKSVMDLAAQVESRRERKLAHQLQVRIESRSLDYYGVCRMCINAEVAAK